MRCKHCGAEIIRIHTMGGPTICWASPTTYWPVRNNEARELLTLNGSSVYGNLTGELQNAVGIGYLSHTCHRMLLILQGRDSWDRPVYKGPDGNLYVDVGPRKDWRPNICTKYQTTLMGNRMILWKTLTSSLRRAGMSGKAEVIELIEKRSTIIKTMLRSQFQQGHTLNNLLAFGPGQDCEIFKADKFYPGDVVIYVPDVYLNHIPLDRAITDPEELDEVLSQCYTGQDFIDECRGDVERAKFLFGCCDWQQPSSAIDELAG